MNQCKALNFAWKLYKKGAALCLKTVKGAKLFLAMEHGAELYLEAVYKTLTVIIPESGITEPYLEVVKGAELYIEDSHGDELCFWRQ